MRQPMSADSKQSGQDGPYIAQNSELFEAEKILIKTTGIFARGAVGTTDRCKHRSIHQNLSQASAPNPLLSK